MLTREEALQMTHNCRITSLGELAHGYVIYQVASKEIINQIFDDMEQHIKSLEDELANTKQLTCESCRYLDNSTESEYNTFKCCNPLGGMTKWQKLNSYCSDYEPKDTQ